MVQNMKNLLPQLYRGWPLLALPGPALAYLATSAVGPGVNGDSLRYLSVAQNIRNGLGAVDYALEPLLAWPPFYPLVLSLAPDVYLFAWILNTLLFGLNIYLAGKLAATLLPNFPPAPALAALATLTSWSILRLHTAIFSDALFLAIILGFLNLSARWQSIHQSKRLGAMLILAACAGMVKYPGLALALIGSVVIARSLWSKGPLRALSLGASFSILAGIPLATWVLLHNIMQHGSTFGERGSGLPLDNLTITVEKMLVWFLPFEVIGRASPFVFALALILLAVLLFKPVTWQKLIHQLLTPPFLPVSLFFGIYLLMMIFLVSYAEHKVYYLDRLHIQLFIPLFCILLALFSNAELVWKPQTAPGRLLTISLLFALWLPYPLSNTFTYVRASLNNGEIAGNLYNTLALNQSDIVTYLRAHPLPPSTTLYSNHEGASWLFTRHNTLSMPQGQVNQEKDIDVPQILAAYADWPPARGYIIWFDLGFKQHILHPDNLSSLANIEPLFIGKDGAIYLIEPRTP
jgi:hypothetical protein